MSDNVVELVQEAQKRGKFSLADAIKGRAYPEKTVDVYIDAASGIEFESLQEEIKNLTPGTEEYEAKYAEMEKVAEKIKQSKLTFHLRGVGQGTVEKITKEADAKYPDAGIENSDWLTYYLCGLVASNIVKVVDVDGNEDDSTFTTEEIIELRGVVPIDSWAILIDTMQKLTLASSYFDSVTDAGFLPKS
jgi:hypothetical protein